MIPCPAGMDPFPREIPLPVWWPDAKRRESQVPDELFQHWDGPYGLGRTVGTLGELWDEFSPNVTKPVVFLVANCGKKFQLKTVQVCGPWCRKLKLCLQQMVSHRMFIVGIVTPRVIDLGNLGVAVVAVGQKSKRHVTYA